MAIISSANLLCSVSLFHLSIAYFFLVSPSIIADQNLVYIFGAAMDLVSRMKLMSFLCYTNFSRSLQVCFFPLIIALQVVPSNFDFLQTLSTTGLPFGQPYSSGYR